MIFSLSFHDVFFKAENWIDINESLHAQMLKLKAGQLLLDCDAAAALRNMFIEITFLSTLLFEMIKQNWTVEHCFKTVHKSYQAQYLSRTKDFRTFSRNSSPRSVK